MALWLPSGNEFNTSLSVSWWTCVRIANISISTGASASSPEKSWAAATSPLPLVKIQMSSTSICMGVLTGEHCYFCRWKRGFHCGSCQLDKFCQAKIPFSDRKVRCPMIPDISFAISFCVVSTLFAYSILEVTCKNQFVTSCIAKEIPDSSNSWKCVNWQLHCMGTVQPCAGPAS